MVIDEKLHDDNCFIDNVEINFSYKNSSVSILWKLTIDIVFVIRYVLLE